MADDIVDALLDAATRRYYGKYRGIVTDVNTQMEILTGRSQSKA